MPASRPQKKYSGRKVCINVCLARQPVLQAEKRDALDLFKGRLELRSDVVLQPHLEVRQDLVLGAVLDGEDVGKAEAVLVGFIE